MHRTTHVPRFLFRGLLLALLLSAGTALGQPPEALPPPAGGPVPVAAGRIETVSINATKKIGMTNRAPIKNVQSENPKVIRVQTIENDVTAVLVTGLAGGTSRVTFTDIKGNTEMVDVRVPDEYEQRRLDLVALIRRIAPTAAVDVNVAPNNTVILTGYLTDAEKAQAIMEAARAYFTVQIGNARLPANVINNMKIGGVQTVQLEVVVAVVNRSETRNMTFSWVLNGKNWFANSILGSPLNPANTLAASLTGAAATLSGTPNLNYGVMGSQTSFTGYLQALRVEGLAKVLADSRVTTLSGRPAFLVSGGETPILTSAGVGAPSVTYKQFGTVVNFLPIVLGDGRIHLEVRPELSARDDANGISIPGVTPTVVPGFTTRTAQVTVQLEDGQTLAIGGLIQNSINGTINKVPVLGDIPFINTLFTSKSYAETEEELVILVTPRLVDGISCTQFPKFLPGRETRSPDDFELFLEGILEAPRGARTVFSGHGLYEGAHKLSANANTIPCANGAGCYRTDGVGCGAGGCGTGNCGVSGYGLGLGGCANGRCGNGAPAYQTLPSGLQGSPTMPAATSQYGGEAPALPTVRDLTPVLPAGAVAPAVMPASVPAAAARENPVSIPPINFGRALPE